MVNYCGDWGGSKGTTWSVSRICAKQTNFSRARTAILDVDGHGRRPIQALEIFQMLGIASSGRS